MVIPAPALHKLWTKIKAAALRVILQSSSSLHRVTMHSLSLVLLPALALALPQNVDWKAFNLARLTAEDADGALLIPGTAGGLPVQVSPSMRSSLAYFVNSASLDTCGQQSKVYIEALLAGKGASEAVAEATSQYVKDYNNGERPVAGSACEASDKAWRKAVREREDPVLASALAFIEKYDSDSPCYAATKSYMKAIVAGKTHLQANKISALDFGKQLQKLAASGKKTIDPICAQTAIDYASSIEVKPSPPNFAAMKAFMEKAMDLNNGYHPACWKSALSFFESYDSSAPEMTNNFAAARAFISAYRSEPTNAAQSPCAAATLAYAKELANSQPAPKNAAAMLGFIEEAIRSGSEGQDPVCATAAEAFYDVFLSGGTDEEATAAASVAFIDAVDRNPSYSPNSACGKSAAAYMAANF